MWLAIFLLGLGVLAAVLYLVAVRRGMSPDEPEHGRDKNQRHMRDVQPPW